MKMFLVSSLGYLNIDTRFKILLIVACNSSLFRIIKAYYYYIGFYVTCLVTCNYKLVSVRFRQTEEG
jgi:hypothetical protein